MTVLVTGGAGFIGSHLVERLLAETDRQVVVIDNFNDYYAQQLKRDNIAALATNSRVKLVEGDYRDFDLAAHLLLEHSVTAICHLGASPGVPASLREPRSYIENNVTGTLSLL